MRNLSFLLCPSAACTNHTLLFTLCCMLQAAQDTAESGLLPVPAEQPRAVQQLLDNDRALKQLGTAFSKRMLVEQVSLPLWLLLLV